jgi:hypothetical protein
MTKKKERKKEKFSFMEKIKGNNQTYLAHLKNKVKYWLMPFFKV